MARGLVLGHEAFAVLINADIAASGCARSAAASTAAHVDGDGDRRGWGNDHAAEASEGIVHMPELGANLLRHADAVTGVAGGTLAVDWPARQELLLHFKIELEAAAGENDAFVGLDEIGLAANFGPDAGDFARRQLDERFARRFIHHFHVSLADLFAEWGPKRRSASHSAVVPGAHGGCAGEFRMFGLEDTERVGPDTQRLKPIVEFELLIDQGLDTVFGSKAVAQRGDVLDGLLAHAGGRGPPHVARDLAVTTFLLLLHLLENEALCAGISGGNGGGEAGMPCAHDDHIDFLVPLLRQGIRLRGGGRQSADHARGGGRAGDHRALKKLSAIYRRIVTRHKLFLSHLL